MTLSIQYIHKKTNIWICSANVFMLKTHLNSENVLLTIFWKLQKICISNSENWTVWSRQCGGFLDYLQREWSSQWLNNQEINITSGWSWWSKWMMNWTNVSKTKTNKANKIYNMNLKNHTNNKTWIYLHT